LDPKASIGLFAAVAFVIAFCSASQDIVIDAYRREILPDNELGIGSALYVNGYRIGMWLAGGVAFILADYIDWSGAYSVMGCLMLLSMVLTVLAREPKVDAPPPKTLRESVVGPLTEFFKRDGAWLILAFIVLYKIGESMASDMTNPLFLQVGFTKTEIGAVAKTFGLGAAISGGLVGGLFIIKLGIYRALWIYGIAQSLGLLLFSWLAIVGPDWTWLAIAIVIETFTSGMATTAFVAFMASQTNKRFTATQYALLSSLMSVPRILGGMGSGWLAEQSGWVNYFILCTLFTIPGLLILFKIKPMIAPEKTEVPA
jgi:PAT family beta-lactamase induction signal transducer AmpG